MLKINQPATAHDAVMGAVKDERSNRMSAYEIAYMLALCARLPGVYVNACTRLDSTIFSKSEAHFVLFWRGVVAASDSNNGRLPKDPQVAKELVASKCASELAADTTRTYYSSDVENKVMADGGLLDELFNVAISDELELEGFNLLQRFHNERRVVDAFRLVAVGLSGNDTLKNPNTVIQLLNDRMLEGAGIGYDPISDGVLDNEDFFPKAAQTYTTQMQFLDELLGGGHAPQECYTVLGPTSGGKTAFCVQLALEGAMYQAALASDIGPDQAGHWYYFTYELNEEQIRQRINIYGAKIHWDTYNKTKNPNKTLSTSTDLSTIKEYEKDPYINSPGNPIKGELERLRDLKARMSGKNSYLRIVDFSGTYPASGKGGVPEIVKHLQREMSRGKRIAGIVIDYAGLCINRMINSDSRYRPESEFSLLSQFVDTIRNQICVPMNCTGWVPHQLHGDSTKRAPGVVPHHSEARGCRNFADNADFSVQMSAYHKTTGLMTFGSTKHRRAPGREEGVIVRFDGALGCFRYPDSVYMVDPHTKQIVPRDYLDTQLSAPISRVNMTRGSQPVNPMDDL